MSEQKRVRLFRSGRHRAVCIPVEFELPGDEAIMHRDGERLVIEPVRKRGLVALLKSMKPVEEGLPGVHDPVPTARWIETSLRLKRATGHRVRTITEDDKYGGDA